MTKDYVLSKMQRVILEDILVMKASHVRYEARARRYVFYNSHGTVTALSEAVGINIPMDQESLITDLLAWQVEVPAEPKSRKRKAT
jgi:hypothetical protein